MHTKAPGHAGVIEEEAQCTFTPHINPASEQLLEDSLQVPANFYERQRFFYEMRQERMQRLQAEAVSLLSGACLEPLHSLLFGCSCNLAFSSGLVLAGPYSLVLLTEFKVWLIDGQMDEWMNGLLD